MSNTLIVTIMRGVPGSGKSTYAREAYPNAVVCSADHFFTGPDGVYRFDPTKLPTAHEACWTAFMAAVDTKQPNIVVDNTNTRLWEMKRYVDHATMMGYEVEIVEVQCPPAVAAARGLHNVPLASVQRMHSQLQPVPKDWPVKRFYVPYSIPVERRPNE